MEEGRTYTVPSRLHNGHEIVLKGLPGCQKDLAKGHKIRRYRIRGCIYIEINVRPGRLKVYSFASEHECDVVCHVMMYLFSNDSIKNFL